MKPVRVSLAAHVRSLKKPSISERNDLEEKRRRLQIRISNYEKQCASLTVLGDEGMDLEWNDLLESEDDMEGDAGDSEDEDDLLQPEAVVIFLPSNVSHEHRQGQYDLEEMGRCEVKLRVGQINDALQRLRIALGEKSLLYRAKAGQCHTLLCKYLTL